MARLAKRAPAQACHLYEAACQPIVLYGLSRRCFYMPCHQPGGAGIFRLYSAQAYPSTAEPLQRPTGQALYARSKNRYRDQAEGT